MVSVYLFPLIVAFIAIGGFDVGATQIGCRAPDERCLPIRHCPPVYNRALKDEHKHNITFGKELFRRICQPKIPMETKTHICCPKPHIECRLNEKPGACLLREQCPTLKSTPERQLMRSIEQNLCYVHDAKNYFCCTDDLCASIKSLCDHPPLTNHRTSAFPRCASSNGAAGFLVPELICSDQARSPKQTADRVCCVPPKIDHLISHPNAAKLAQTTCGTIGSINKIENGTFAQRGEFPWMVKLVYKRKEVCSGTLIHPRFVLTARHCINTKLTKVQLGIHDLRKKDGVQEIKIVKTSLHNIYDVGLLELAKPAMLDEDLVQPICLPVYASLRMYLPRTVTISGWGMMKNHKLPSVLMKADTSVSMNEQTCNNDHMICVGGLKHLNHCPGDSGGPYQALSTFGELSGGRYVQYGIISDGPAYCSSPDRPSRGVLVGYVIDWILDHMQL
uniref:Peptidase S1 domain-containing protein n=1 Tax=Anopheles funestus TaxID=62324 RepID=A0A182R5Z1_ANOFN